MISSLETKALMAASSSASVAECLDIWAFHAVNLVTMCEPNIAGAFSTRNSVWCGAGAESAKRAVTA